MCVWLRIPPALGIEAQRLKDCIHVPNGVSLWVEPLNVSGSPCFVGPMSVTRTEVSRSEWLEGKLICQSVVQTLVELDADHRLEFQ